MTICKWPTKPLSQVQVTINETSIAAQPERAYFDAVTVQEAINEERAKWIDAIMLELDGNGQAQAIVSSVTGNKSNKKLKK